MKLFSHPLWVIKRTDQENDHSGSILKNGGIIIA